MVHHTKVGLLIANIGSPESPDKQSVKPYLTEFLMDERIIDLPKWRRQLLVKGIIVPFRSGRSAEAYHKIWLPQGSPLIFYSETFTRKLQTKLPEHIVCRYGSRYGRPSFRDVLQSFQQDGIKEIFLAPMFPQYAAATTDSSVVHLQKEMAASETFKNVPLRVLDPFYQEPVFIDAWRRNYEKYRGDFVPDQVVFSFHGLPKRQILKADPSQSHCLQNEGKSCCDHPPAEILTQCYRAQCFATARRIADAIGLKKKEYQISFQSRLGRDPWIPPYTVDMLDQLIAKGVKRVLFLCPAFVADCLETLEEIAISLGEGWKRAGGEELRLIPSLNAEDHWVEAFAGILENRGSAPSGKSLIDWEADILK